METAGRAFAEIIEAGHEQDVTGLMRQYAQRIRLVSLCAWGSKLQFIAVAESVSGSMSTKASFRSVPRVHPTALAPTPASLKP